MQENPYLIFGTKQMHKTSYQIERTNEMEKRLNPSKWIKFFSFGLLMATALIVSACGNIGGPSVQDQAATYAVQTLQAIQVQQTLGAYETQVAQATQMAAATPTPTAEPATATAEPTAEPTKTNCNLAEFIKDVSYVDGTAVSKGEAITKTWRVKNIGSCTWTTDYDLVLVDGQSMGAPTRIGLETAVKPGETVDLSVLMAAPAKAGTYMGYWMLEDANGNRFGVGDGSKNAFWVKVVVVQKVAYNFVDNYCQADWSSYNTSSLPCPGTENDNRTGFVYRVNTPTREDGSYENEAAIFTSPDNDSANGKIVGVYPAFKVMDGDVFKAVIGCQHGADKCDLTFELLYQIDGGTVKTLASWREIYDNKMNSVSVDLSSLAGKEVTFYLRVLNYETAAENVGMWIQPRILR